MPPRGVPGAWTGPHDWVPEDREQTEKGEPDRGDTWQTHLNQVIQVSITRDVKGTSPLWDSPQTENLSSHEKTPDKPNLRDILPNT